MNLMVSIVLSTVAGYLLLLLDPLFGGLIAFGIVAGTLFRVLYLLIDMEKRLSKIVPKTDKVTEVYENYLKERDKAV